MKIRYTATAELIDATAIDNKMKFSVTDVEVRDLPMALSTSGVDDTVEIAGHTVADRIASAFANRFGR